VSRHHEWITPAVHPACAKLASVQSGLST